MGRTSFLLDKNALRELRKKRGLSQRDVEEALALALNRPYPKFNQRKEDDHKRDQGKGYQRIELRGKTSPKTAQALATFFGVSLETLQGQAPGQAESIDQLALRLQRAHASGGSKLVAQAIANADAPKTVETICRALAEKLAPKLASARLSGNRQALQQLADDSGLSIEQLCVSFDSEGAWYVHDDQSLQRIQISQGLYSVIDLIRNADMPYLKDKSDTQIKLTKEDPWYRLEIGRLTHADRIQCISFARCQPDSVGLHWNKSSESDAKQIARWLKDWAYESANIVHLLDEGLVPGDVSQLRLRLTHLSEAEQTSARPAIISPEIAPDMASCLLASERERGKSHRFVLNCLMASLEAHLRPQLQAITTQGWRVLSDDGRKIGMWPPLEAQVDTSGPRYRLELVWEAAPGQYQPAPLREADRQYLIKQIQGWLG
ncbi:helix-turn-helix transcriptional regulator [Chitinimonas taiwanensis]|uniref:helix-turn-helix transcriptional regulator n=1 Tax=Chitinimonas taiwanensis TaxID=240412 RepID=UPI0035AF08C6